MASQDWHGGQFKKKGRSNTTAFAELVELTEGYRVVS